MATNQMSEKQTMVVEVPPTVVHPAVDPKPITYVVLLNPGETPTDYDMSGGIPGDHPLDWFSTRDFPVEEDSSIEDIIKVLEYEHRYEKPSFSNDPTVSAKERRDLAHEVFNETLANEEGCSVDDVIKKSLMLGRASTQESYRKAALAEVEAMGEQLDHVVECWHRRDRLWVIFHNDRRYVDPEGKWEDYFAPHEKGVCDWPQEDCESCLMAAILRHTGLDHGIESRESALEKIRSFAEYWIWEDWQLRGGE